MAAGGTHIALESTGGPWRPVVHRLGDHLTVLLVNAHHITAVPGRQTDVRDGEWLCALRRHGRLQGRIMPPRPIRAWRALTRHRQIVGSDRAAVAHRLQTRLESANLQRGHVATHVWGFSGRCMRQALVHGEADAAPRAPLAQGTLTAKAAPRQPSLTGRVRPTPRVLLHAR